MLLGMLHPNEPDGGWDRRGYPLSLVARGEGHDFVRFMPEGIDLEAGTVRGFAWEAGRWEERTTRFPDVVVNRRVVLDAGSPRVIREFLGRVPHATQPGMGKNAMIAALRRAGRFAKHLPETADLDGPATVLRFLERDGRVMLKPVGAGQGEGIVGIEKTPDGWAMSEGFTRKAISAEEIAALAERLKAQRPYMVQQFVAGTLPAGNPFALRVHLQKGAGAKWVVGGFLGQIAPHGCHVANTCTGGAGIVPVHLFRQVFGGRWRVVERALLDWSMALATHVDELTGRPHDEMGIDCSVDSREFPWIYEVQFMPGGPWVTDPEFLRYHRNLVAYLVHLATRAPARAAVPSGPLAGRLEAGAVEKRVAPSAADAGFVRPYRGASISTLGIGVRTGAPAAGEAVLQAVRGGVNVLETSLAADGMRAERRLRAALRTLAAEGVPRESLLVATGGGRVCADADDKRSAADYVHNEYVARRVISAADAQAGTTLSRAFLERQLSLSLDNLGVRCVDLYYLEDVDRLRQRLGPEVFSGALTRAFALLEAAVADGRIGAYGVSAFVGLRAPPDDPSHLPIESLVAAAEAAGGADHHFAALRLPVNADFVEPWLHADQTVDGRRTTTLRAAEDFGLAVFASYPLRGGNLLHRDGAATRASPGLPRATAALQFARSVPGVRCAVPGLGSPGHVEAALALAKAAPLGENALLDARAPDEALAVA